MARKIESSVRREAFKIERCGAWRRFLSVFVRVCFLDRAKLHWLVLASCVPLFISVWLMLSPGVIYSNAMTCDLLYNLEGAWRLYTGQVQHVDFHDKLGVLAFAITALGFHLFEIKPMAFAVGESALAAVLTAVSILAVKDRLPILPAFLFVTMNAVLVLAPANLGSRPDEFTFAMGYNRFGWTATSILFLLLFIEPRGTRAPVWTDLGIGLVLTVGLFYLKITYFMVAVATIYLALLTSPYVRRHWLGWCGVLLLATFAAVAPMNEGYRADIMVAIGGGAIRSNLRVLVTLFTVNSIGEIWVLGEIIVMLYLWTQRFATLSDVIIGLYIWVSGFFLISQNQQFLIIPIYSVLTLLLYVRLVKWSKSYADRQWTLVGCLMTCSLLPLLPPLWSNMLNLTMYNIKARHSSQAFVVTTGNLQGLVVPTDRDDTLDEVAAGNRQDIFNRIRAFRNQNPLSEQEYIKTVVSLAEFLREKDLSLARIVVIDQMNPLPFVLGAPAPRGGNLWAGDPDWRPAEEALREADYVAIPHFPTDRAILLSGLKAYHEYLLSRFVQRWETPYWTVFERLNAQ